MHFDQRTQTALRDAGLSLSDLKTVSQAIVETTQADADRLRAFFEGHDTVYSDMDLAHSRATFPEHTVSYCDLFTHGADIRGYLRFDSWGVPVEGGRVLSDDVVELKLGATVHDRVRFATSRDAL
ncbi:hypothetical protein [Haladaptatus sp. DJG-WS-42]|uniref:DUF7532 family protein n=1 Tax=Haladaptatus sp. DJG-WS-42 TaxID=3120516 RepID=UPI0030D47AA2